MRRFTPLPALLALAAPLLAGPPADPDPKSLAIPAEAAAEAKGLVGKFGSKSFAERDQATEDARKLARQALPALEAALASMDPEVRLRVELLLPAARADDFRARVDCYLADKGRKFTHDLPAATAFFAVAGRSDAAEAMFREMAASASRDILMAVGRADELPRAVLDRKAEFQRRLATAGVVIVGNNGVVQPPAPPPALPTAADLAAIFFAESTLAEKALGTPPGYQATTLLNQTAMRAALTAGPEKEPMTKIVAAWCGTRDEPATMYSAMTTLRTYLPAESLRLAGRVLAAKAGLPGTQKCYAMGIVAQFGGPADHAALLPYLKDDGVAIQVAGPGGRVPLQTRDAALAMLALATKQNPEDYGLSYRYKGSPNVSDTMKYGYMHYSFDGADADARRAEGLKKWDAWLAANKDAVKK